MYGQVSSKYIMGGLNNLQKLCITDVKDVESIQKIRVQLVVNCKEDQEGIRKMITDGKKKFDEMAGKKVCLK